MVDDSAVARRLLTDALSREPGFTVAGFAPNGRIGVQKVAQLHPDVVILDVEMPEMNGLEALVEIRRQWPELPVIMFSRLTERGASVTLDALLRGASDFCEKPGRLAGSEDAASYVRQSLAPKIRALCPERPAPRPIDAVLIGSSTGGPNALNEIVMALPANLGVPILITQHMPPVFTRLLAERLTARGPIPFAEAEPGMAVEAGRGYVAPGDHHLLLKGGRGAIRLALDQGPPENSCRPAADPMLRSAVAVLGSGVLAVVLTGMGQDGLRGCEKVREAGGQVIVQDEASSVVWGMPGHVARAGLADEVLPLPEIGPAILRRVRRVAGLRAVAVAGRKGT